MNDFLIDFQVAIQVAIQTLKSFLSISIPFLFSLLSIFCCLKFVHNLIVCGSSFSISDIFSGLIEWIFYREKFTCKMDSDKCALFDYESNIDFGEFSCSKHCEHYGKCLNCMFFDYEEDKYICGKCYHRHERRELKNQLDS